MTGVIPLSGVNVIITHDGGIDQKVPHVTRRPEWLHALETLLQNAKQFAIREVRIHIKWPHDIIEVIIHDDGSGFPSSVLAYAGQPWNSSRTGHGGHRGLGLFIARTLLESIGGSVYFGNGADGGGKVELKVPQVALSGSPPPPA